MVTNTNDLFKLDITGDHDTNEFKPKKFEQFAASQKRQSLRRVNSFGNKENLTKNLLIEEESLDNFKLTSGRLKERQESLRHKTTKKEIDINSDDESDECTDEENEET